MKGNFDAGSLVRSEIRDLMPYTSVTYPGVIKLDANENPYPFPGALQDKIIDAMEAQHFTRYPDAMSGALVGALSDIYQVPRDGIMVGNGSDELILNLMLTFGAGNRVVIPVPTFSMYRIHALVAGARVDELPRGHAFELPVEDIIRAGKGAGLVIICSPNNPSGNSATPEQVTAILEGCHCPVVVDQAYLEFGGADLLPLLPDYENLVLLRTFSKAFGLAGLRVGYMFAHPGVMQYLLKVKQPFNLNSFSQLAALTVLRHRHLMAGQVAEIISQRDMLYRALSEIPGLEVWPSDTNYLLFAPGAPPAAVHDGLLKEKVLVRNFGDPLLKRYLRVTVGTPEENKIFLQALRKVIATLGEKKNG